MGMRLLLIVALASSAVAFAQNGQRGTQRGKAGTARASLLTHMICPDSGTLPTRTATRRPERTSNNRPQMTPWGLEKFRKTKTGDANALSNGASRTKKIGMIRSGGVIRRAFHGSCGAPRRRE
jgi:hypothetical protein